jgi:putative transposase
LEAFLPQGNASSHKEQEGVPMSSSELPAASPSCQTLLQSLLQVEGLPFAEVLTDDDCQRLFGHYALSTEAPPNPGPTASAANDTTCLVAPPTAAGATAPPAAARCPIWTPVLTVWTFLQQVLAPVKSCTAAVVRATVLLTELRCSTCSENPGAFSKARGRLPQGLLRDLTLHVGQHLEDASPESWRWLGHRVFAVDGWVVTLPDTPENQQAYPQPKSQKKGLGFPQVRLVGLFSLACNILVEVQWGPCQGKRTGETALLRDIMEQLRPGDVLVADRYYCSYFMIWLLKQLGVEVVFHLHQRRQHTFGKGQRLAEEDEIVVWQKPSKCPEWLAAESYAALPDTLEIRIVGVIVHQRGFRVQHYHIATTLLNATVYSKAAVSSLYRDRWAVEGMIRSLKTYMSMEMLRCQTPAMVHKEIWTYLLGYNVTRKIMAQAARRHGYQPWEISFSQTLQALDAYRYPLAKATPAAARAVAEQLLLGLTKLRVGHRPDRVEPRRVKRRPKPYGYLTKPRDEARQEILDRPGGEPRRKGQRRRTPPAGSAATGSDASTSGAVP